MTDADDLVFLTNTPSQAEYLLHRLEQAARGIGFYVNTYETVFMCFKHDQAISTLSGKLLKLFYQFSYLSSNISSTESNVNICIGKTWIAIERLIIIWKFDLTDEIKWDFFQAVTMSVLLYGSTTRTKCLEKS